ncbi:O-methyltransferase [Psychromicrobium xiongbiense]|uniref:O-methyltransferase n=1 Tax=Psychromicrobium xiongbiense TaxID=3051184 RepID=UPI002553A02B|nr:O-methyltransferase [Psychromicrobium sp. YIM S02556]
MSIDKSIVWSYVEGLPLEDQTLLRARDRARDLGVASISPATGALLSVLAASSKAHTVVEIGARTGVSGIYLLRGLSPQAVLTSIDVDAEHLKACRDAFSEAGFPGNRTRTISGRANDVLPRLTDAAYDLVFLNADKSSYPGYIEQGIRLLKPSGLLVVHDALDGGRVAEPARREEHTVLLRKAAKELREDPRLLTAVVPVGDALLLATKR